MVAKAEQLDELFTQLEITAHNYYGEELPPDFVWDVLPLMYIRLSSATSWTRIKGAVSRVRKQAAGTLEDNGTTVTGTIDQYLGILSTHYDAANILRAFSYGPTGLSEEYLCELFDIVDEFASNSVAFYETYCRYMVPMNDDVHTTRFSDATYDFACRVARAARCIRAANVAYCFNFCWPELVESVYTSLHCRQLIAMDAEYQSVYFEGLYTHMRGRNCEFKAGMFADEAFEGEQWKGANAFMKRGRASYAIGAVPQGGDVRWGEKALTSVKLGAGAVFLLDFDPEAAEGWFDFVAGEGCLAIFKLPDAWVVLMKKVRASEEPAPANPFRADLSAVDDFGAAVKETIANFRTFQAEAEEKEKAEQASEKASE